MRVVGVKGTNTRHAGAATTAHENSCCPSHPSKLHACCHTPCSALTHTGRRGAVRRAAGCGGAGGMHSSCRAPPIGWSAPCSWSPARQIVRRCACHLMHCACICVRLLPLRRRAYAYDVCGSCHGMCRQGLQVGGWLWTSEAASMQRLTGKAVKAMSPSSSSENAPGGQQCSTCGLQGGAIL